MTQTADPETTEATGTVAETTTTVWHPCLKDVLLEAHPGLRTPYKYPDLVFTTGVEAYDACHVPGTDADDEALVDSWVNAAAGRVYHVDDEPAPAAA